MAAIASTNVASTCLRTSGTDGATAVVEAIGAAVVVVAGNVVAAIDVDVDVDVTTDDDVEVVAATGLDDEHAASISSATARMRFISSPVLTGTARPTRRLRSREPSGAMTLDVPTKRRVARSLRQSTQ